MKEKVFVSRIAVGAIFLTSLLFLSGCSDPAEPETQGSEREVWQACTEFVEGAVIPDQAAGCIDSAGHKEAYLRIECESGVDILRYAEDTWTVDGIVIEGNEDEFRQDLETCQPGEVNRS